MAFMGVFLYGIHNEFLVESNYKGMNSRCGFSVSL